MQAGFHPRRGFVLACALALGACGGGGAETTPWRDRDLVVLVVDALRADALSCYASEVPTTPRFDRLANESVRVERVRSPASYTLASTASLFTGLAPVRHGTLGLSTNVLPDACRTLAEALVDEGYATLGLSCNPNVSPPGAFDQGFERFRFHLRDRLDVHVVPDAVLDDLAGFLEPPAARPRFAYVHVLPPHAPYDPPPQDLALVGATGTTSREGSHEYLEELGAREGLTAQAPDVTRVRSRYLAGVQVADRWLGEVLDRLTDPLAQAVLVVTSDHGESFAEHGFLSHGPSVYTEALAVPLLVRTPGLVAGVVPGPVSTLDLAATLCEGLGVPWSSNGSAGRSFLGHLFAEAGAPDRGIVARGTGQRPFWSLERDGLTIVAQPTSGYVELYDANGDPEQRRDLAPERGAEARERLEELRARLADDREARVVRTGPRRHRTLAKELAALGYTGEEGEPE